MKESKLLCILASGENHASVPVHGIPILAKCLRTKSNVISRMDIGSQGRCNDFRLKTSANQTKTHAQTSNDNEWRKTAC